MKKRYGNKIGIYINMAWKKMVSYKHLVGCTLKGRDKSGKIVDTLITKYNLDYDKVFKESDGHEGTMIHTLTFEDGTSFTFVDFSEVIQKYGDLDSNHPPVSPVRTVDTDEQKKID
tara:strand:+ start:392 stop:739 length:348 start_codon:yes stop_codon:yes gene_type:complete